MRHLRSLCVAAAIGGLSVSCSAGFTFAVNKVDVVVNGTQFDRYDIFATNTGVGTGVDIKGLIYQYVGDKAYFSVLDTDADRVPDKVNLDSATLTRVRVTTSASANLYANVIPTLGHAQPNPYLPGVHEFSGAVVKTAGPVPIAPVQIARLFLLDGTVGTFSGQIGGEIGPLVPFTTTPITFARDRPVFASPEPLYLTFESDYAARVPFMANVEVSDPDAGDVLSLSADMVLGLHDVQIAGGGVGPQTFTVTGSIDASKVGTVVYLPLRARDGTGNLSTDSLSLVVLPEPTALFSLGAATILTTSRSRRRLSMTHIVDA